MDVTAHLEPRPTHPAYCGSAGSGVSAGLGEEVEVAEQSEVAEGAEVAEQHSMSGVPAV